MTAERQHVPPGTKPARFLRGGGSRAAAALFYPLLAGVCHGQDIEPRRWSHLPIGGSFGGMAFAFSTGDILLDPDLKIEDAEFDLQTIGAKYIRSFALLGKSARFDIMQSYQSGTWTGLLNGAPAKVERSGRGDAAVRFAVNLLGAPPLEGREFAAYRTDTECETIVGMGLVMQLPTGEYFEDKLINLGSNRFGFRPQLGVVHKRGRWTMELTNSVLFLTDNDNFFNGNRQNQNPVYTADANLIYNFRPGLWLAASAGYAGGGETSINEVSSHNRQNYAGWALSFGIPINRAVGLKFAYIGTRTHADTGADTDTFTGGLTVAW